ncbi:MAG: helix-hairpin-helix domain-containing protein [Halovenus sp.]
MSEKKSLLQKLKDLLNISRLSRPAAESESPAERSSDITVEREPDSATEDAVKGTETAADQTDAGGGEESTASATVADDTAVTAEREEAAPADAGQDGDPVDEIKGIGPTYAERLGEAGISTVADLVAADAATVADAAQASESRATDWIERAQNYD